MQYQKNRISQCQDISKKRFWTKFGPKWPKFGPENFRSATRLPVPARYHACLL